MIYTSPLLKAADGSQANTLLNMLAFQTMTLDGWTYDGIRSPYWRILSLTACLMLHHSDKNIDEIAEVCGFCDRFHFSHAFTRSRGNTPGRFRRQLQAGAL